ncbi:cytochrome C oxidase subunit II [Halalkalibacter kiskunsagensis]|uniref:Cytochrome C oxidase subunit II n=1 Tax=Halalkalibacter kiskunsagensis TaxID=1548599 RepID=A0ABV6KEF8_9BACI
MRKLLVSGMIIWVVAVLTACGGSSDEPTTTENEEATTIESSNTVVLEASNWDFDQEVYTVQAGEVTIELKNVEGYYGVVIDGTDLKIDGDGEQTVTLEAGEYIIYCSIPCGGGHDEMTATLIVE